MASSIIVACQGVIDRWPLKGLRKGNASGLAVPIGCQWCHRKPGLITSQRCFVQRELDDTIKIETVNKII